MTDLMVKALLLLLAAILMARAYIGWIKANKAKKSGIVKIIFSIIFICLFVCVELFETTMFEFLLGFAVAFLLFAFRKRISKLFAKLCNSKFGKVKAVSMILLFPVGIWLALALFYRTPLGMPIGVKNYLYHKYDEEFEMSRFWAATPAGHPINEFTCWPKNGNRQTDSFNVVRKNTLSVGSRSFASDNYYGIIIREDYENYISEIVSKYFDEHKIYVRFATSGISNTMYMSDVFNKKTSLDEFLKFQKDKLKHHSRNTANVDIFLPQQYSINDKDLIVTKIQKLCDELKNDFCYIKVNILVFTEESRYNYKSLTLSNYLNWRDSNNWDYDPKRIVFRLNHNSELSYFIIDEDFFKEET